MSFLDKIFVSKTQKLAHNQDALEFINSTSDGCEQWFDQGHDDNVYSEESKKVALSYIKEFGLEKNSKDFIFLPELKSAIADYFKRSDIKCDVGNIIARAGIFEFLQDLYQILAFKNDEKILFSLPVSSYFVQHCYDREIAAEFLNTDYHNNWKINFSDLEDKLKNNKIRILFLNDPNNTTGKVLDQKDVLNLVNVLKNHKDLLVIVDESLKEMALSEKIESLSLAANNEIAPQIITLSSLKCYGLSSLEIVFACIRQKSIITELFSEKLNVSYVNQQIAIAALASNEDNQRYLSDVIEQCSNNSVMVWEELLEINKNLSRKFGKKDDFIKPLLDGIKTGDSMLLQFSGLKGSQTEVDKKTLKTDLDIAEFLKKEANIIMMPGQCYFLPEEEMILRLYLLKSKQELRAGFARISQALMKLHVITNNVSHAKFSSLELDSEKKSNAL